MLNALIDKLSLKNDAALAMAEQFGEHAAHQHANLSETGKDSQLTDDDATPGKPSERGHQTHLKEAIENLERGSNTDKEGKSGNGKQAGEQGIVALTAPDGIAMPPPAVPRSPQAPTWIRSH